MYSELSAQLDALLDGETDFIANSSQFSAFVYHTLEDVNWAGFYLYKNDELLLGPFQGKVACVHIPIGKGVCGTAASTLETQLVEDVHQFAGHIACDAASNSEVVIPIVVDGQLIGVFDIDSPKIARFSQQDKKGLEGLVEIYKKHTQF